MAESGRIGRAFVELEARTTGFQQGFDDAQDRLAKAAEFVKGAPTLAFAALAATIGAIGVEAVKMAGEVDGALRRVVAAAPESARDLGKVRDAVRAISIESGQTQEALAGVAARLAEMGEHDPGALADDLKTVSEIAEASGQSLDRVAEGLDAIGDAYRLDARAARDALVEIAAIAQGKIGLDEVLSVIERNGSALAALKIKATDAAAAMATLIDAGVPKRKAGSLLESVLAQADAAAKEGASGTRQQYEAAQQLLASINPATLAAKGLTGALVDLGQRASGSAEQLKRMGFSLDEANAILRLSSAAATDTRTAHEKLADAQAKISAAATVNRGSAEGLAKVLKAELAASMIDLGNIALPAVIGGLRMMVDLMNPAGAAAQALTDRIGTLAEAARRSPRGIVDRNTAEGRATRDAFFSVRDQFTTKGAGFLSELDTGTLDKLLVAYARYGQATNGLLKTDMDIVAAISAVVQARRTEAAETAAAADADEKAATKKANTAAIELERKRAKQELATSRSLESSVSGALAQYVAPSVEAAQRAIDLQVAGWRAMAEELAPKLKKEANELADKFAYIAGVLAPIKQDLGNAADEFAKFQQGLELRQVGNASGVLGPETFAQLDVMIARVNTDLAFMRQVGAEGSAEWKAAEQLLNQLYAARRGLIEKNVDARLKEATAGQKALEQLQLQALTLQQSVQGALQLAAAMGLVDQKTAGILGSLTQVGTNLPILIKQIDLFSTTSQDPTKGIWGALSGVVGSALPVIGGIASLLGGLFADDPQVAANRKAQEDNTRALQELARNIGDLASSTTPGSKLGAAFKVAAGAGEPGRNVLTLPGGSRVDLGLDPQWAVKLSQAFRNAGLSNADINELAKSLGITLNNSSEAWKAFVDALRSADLQGYADTFAGSMKKLQDSFDVYNITDPAEKLRRTIAALSDKKTGIPGIGTALAGLDLSNQSDRAAAIERLQGLFEALANGTIDKSLIGDVLGGADLADALDAIKNLLGQLRGDGSASATGTGGTTVNRQVTEVTANRLVAVLDDSRTFLERIAFNTDALRPGALPPLLPPSLGAAGALTGTVIQISIPVTVVVGAGSDPGAVGTAIGAAAGAAAAQQLGRIFGNDLALRAAAIGARVG